jgi:hypothetical protein
VICFIAFLTRTVDWAVLVLAWTFVGLRVMHSLVHITYNNVFHRLTLFATSMVTLMALWGYVFVRLFR